MLVEIFITGKTASASGDCNRDAGGDIGNSGKSSRNRDMVRFGTPGLTRRGSGFTGGAGVGIGIVVCIESRDVFENEEGPPEFRLFLFAHLRKEIQGRGPLPEASSNPLDGRSDCSVLASDSGGDFERDNFLGSDALDTGLVRTGTSSLISERDSGARKG